MITFSLAAQRQRITLMCIFGLLGWATFAVAQPPGTENATRPLYTATDSRWSFTLGPTVHFINDGQDDGLVRRRWTWRDPDLGHEYFMWEGLPAVGLQARLRFRAACGLGITLGYEQLNRRYIYTSGGTNRQIGQPDSLTIQRLPGSTSGFRHKVTSWRFGFDYAFQINSPISSKALSVAPYAELGIDQYYHNRYRQHVDNTHTSYGLRIDGVSEYITSANVVLRTRYASGATYYPSIRTGLRLVQRLGRRASLGVQAGWRFNPLGEGPVDNYVHIKDISHIQNYPYGALEADGDQRLASPRIVRHPDYKFAAYIGGFTFDLSYVHTFQRYKPAK